MSDAVLTQPAVFFLAVVLVLSLIALAAGYAFAARVGSADGRDEAAFGLGQTAIFGLIVLILAFSFSFAAERFEARRALVVQEADAVASAYAHTDFMPAGRRAVAQDLMRRYVAARLEALQAESYSWEDDPAERRAIAAQRRLWDMATADVRHDPKNLAFLSVAEGFDRMGDVAELQNAAVNNHVPMPILGIVFLSTVLGAALLGLTFGRVRSPNRALSVVFCLLFAATVFTIVDLDHPRGGLLHIDTMPLRNALDDMKP